MTTLHTERLVLRRWRDDDEAPMAAINRVLGIDVDVRSIGDAG